jgi:hypothetical protein
VLGGGQLTEPEQEEIKRLLNEALAAEEKKSAGNPQPENNNNQQNNGGDGAGDVPALAQADVGVAVEPQTPYRRMLVLTVFFAFCS